MIFQKASRFISYTRETISFIFSKICLRYRRRYQKVFVLSKIVSFVAFYFKKWRQYTQNWPRTLMWRKARFWTKYCTFCQILRPDRTILLKIDKTNYILSFSPKSSITKVFLFRNSPLLPSRRILPGIDIDRLIDREICRVYGITF